MGYVGVDSGWAWVVLSACFLSGVLNAFCNYSAGILNVALLDVFDETLASTALVGAVFTSLLCLFGPVSSVIVNLTSCRVTHIIGGILCFLAFTSSYFVRDLQLLYLTYGVVGGIGTGLVASSSLILLGYSFDRYQGIAVGVAVAGAGLGMFISGPGTQWLLDTYGLRGTFLIMGALCSHQIFFGCLMRPSELEILHKNRRTEQERKSKLKSGNSFSVKQVVSFDVFKNKTFCCVLVATLIWNFSYSILLMHLPNFAVTQGASQADGAFLITMVGLGSVINRLLTGVSLSSNDGLDPFLLEFGFLALSGSLTTIFPLISHSQAGRCVFSALFGIYSGGLITLFTPLAVYLLGVAQLPTGIGAFYLASGFGYIGGPPFAGSLLLLSSVIVLGASKWLEESRQNISKENIQVLEPNEAKIISGSALMLSGSFNYIMEIECPSTDEKRQISKQSLLYNIQHVTLDESGIKVMHNETSDTGNSSTGYGSGTSMTSNGKIPGSNGTLDTPFLGVAKERGYITRGRSGTFGVGDRKEHLVKATLSIPDVRVSNLVGQCKAKSSQNSLLKLRL